MCVRIQHEELLRREVWLLGREHFWGWPGILSFAVNGREAKIYKPRNAFAKDRIIAWNGRHRSLTFAFFSKSCLCPSGSLLKPFPAKLMPCLNLAFGESGAACWEGFIPCCWLILWAFLAISAAFPFRIDAVDLSRGTLAGAPAEKLCWKPQSSRYTGCIGREFVLMKRLCLYCLQNDEAEIWVIFFPTKAWYELGLHKIVT